VPSPDPDRQSVQLDLFPADIVQNLVVSKSFAPDSPSNSSGGSLDIVTLQYPEEFEIKLSSGTGGNPFAFDRFLRLNKDSPTGHETDGWNALEDEFGLSIGGPFELFERSFRFKALINRELDYDTAEGTREGREPTTVRRLPNGTPLSTGDLSLGELSLSSGLFDLTESERSEQRTGYASFGFDLDTEGNHKIDFSAFYTKKEDETVELRENGHFPDFDYGGLVDDALQGIPFDASQLVNVATRGAWISRARDEFGEGPGRGPLWYSSFAESRSFRTDRDLKVFQANGEHHFEPIEGLSLKWVANRAKTTQDQASRGVRYFFEPFDSTVIPTTFPVTPDALGTGTFIAGSGFRDSANEVEETQNFGRFDAEYEIPFEIPKLDEVVVKLNAGGWFERSDRDVAASFLESPTVDGSSRIEIDGDDPEQLGENVFGELDPEEDGRPSNQRDTTSKASRDVTAWDVGAKATFWDRVDLLAGVRREKIEIESLNDPFTGGTTSQRELPFGTGAPAIFPSAYLFFDRLDNPRFGEGNPPPGVVYNDQILGIDVPIDPVTGFVDLRDREAIERLVNGFISETKYLPSFGVSYRPIEGLNLRGAYSRTVARPSFRELGYYATVEAGTDDVTVGNPQLQLSDVESFDLRAEYTWGDVGDLVAVSGFAKNIRKPIESIVVRDALNGEFDDSGLFRTFFNNPNEATLRGIEAEARKNLGFVGPEFFEYFSVGGNFTYIKAEVERTEAELARASRLFGATAGVETKVQRYEKKRRLYNQPEWIANADVTFDQPDWGTKLTLSLFAISSVLDAAGVASVDNLGEPRSFTLDRYVDGFYQVDLVASQRIWEGLVLKFSVKNLTNSTRQIVYDQEQTVDQIAERTMKIGRDFSISLNYTLAF
jgi:TonB-dependent receptor